MTTRERFLAVLNGQMPDDRMPMIEWAAWWDQTLRRWEGEGLPGGLSWHESVAYFGLDPMEMVAVMADTPPPPAHGMGIVESLRAYEAIAPQLYHDACFDKIRDAAMAVKARQEAGDSVVRIWLDGFFWFPRKLLGIEPHLYAFYDAPELIHRINSDLAAFHLRALEVIFSVITPDFVGFAEDMSYNHGPMLSRGLFDAFLLPYYHRMIPYVHGKGVRVLADSDGDITTMVPWFQAAGIDGVYPLERQAGVDIAALRKAYPEFIMLGGYDKMVMNKGEAAIRAEFDRILPVMRSGWYIPSVDHQTPPGVSLADYKTYIEVFRQYCELAVR